VTQTHALGRRQFLRHAAVVAGVGLTGFGASGFARATASTAATLAWTLDPTWGFPKGAHGRTSCGCHACVAHAANKVFAMQADAGAGRAHAGCLCEPAFFALRTTIYDALFTTHGVVEVDRRDPRVADLLGSGTQTQVEAFAPARARVGDTVVLTGRRPMTVPGRYRAVAKWKRLPAGDVCMRAYSLEARNRP
jgi:hypothetical protein